jgi:hypothetical protein
MTVSKILRAENLYKQSKFSQRIETTQLIKAFHPLRCFYPLGLILLYSLVGMRRSFVGLLHDLYLKPLFSMTGNVTSIGSLHRWEK